MLTATASEDAKVTQAPALADLAWGEEAVDLRAPLGEGLLVKAVMHVVASFLVNHKPSVPHYP